MSAVFCDVVALVCATDSLQNAKAALQARLRKHGAKVVQRLSKGITHIVYERRILQHGHHDQPEPELLDLFRKLDAMESPPVVVTPLWVAQSLAKNRRLVENKFAVARPRENMLAAPAGGGSTAKKKRSRRAAAAPPKPAENFELDAGDWAFSSSQQIKGGAEQRQRTSGEPSATPRGGQGNTRGARRAEPEGERPIQAGSATQAVADILALDLPGGGDEEDDLDTPLGERFARRAGSLGSKRRRSPAADTAPAGGGARSRLAQASGPGGAAGEEDAEEVPRTQAPGPRPANAPAAAKPAPSVRFSVRQLEGHRERPVAILKGTPLPGTTPRQAPHTTSLRPMPIPVPVVGRVESPWVSAEALPASQGGSQPSTAPGRAAGSTMGPPASRPSLGPSLGPRRSSVSKESAHGTPWTLLKALNARKELPSPWTAPRPWDHAQPKAAAAAEPEGEAREGEAQEQGQEQGASPSQQEDAAAQAEAEARQQYAPPAGTRRRRRGAAAPAVDAEAAGGGGAEGPAQGFLSVTSVGSATAELCRSATRRLCGLRLCPEGREDGAVTHLVMGSERRTLKALLAVANGAWLVSPEWVTASLEAGRWQPEREFPAAAAGFAAAAQRARRLLDDDAPLLGGHVVHVHAGRGRQAAATASAMRRLAAALGAAAGAASACTLCVVVGGGGPPAGLPRGARAVQEEWLLQAAERYDIPAIGAFLFGAVTPPAELADTRLNPGRAGA